MNEGSESRQIPADEQGSEMELTAENKNQFLNSLAENLNITATDSYTRDLALLKVRQAEASGDSKLVSQLWKEFPYSPEGIEQVRERTSQMVKAISRSDVYTGWNIFRPQAARDEALAIVCDLPPEQKSKFKFLIAKRMRNEMMDLTQRMRSAYDWRLRKDKRGEMPIETAIEDYNANMTDYPEQQITGKEAQNVMDFYAGKLTENIVNKYREHLPAEMVSEILKYDDNFVKAA